MEEAAEGSERVRRRSHRRHQEEEAEKKGEGRCISHSAASCSSTRAIRAREAAESGTASSWGVSQDRCARGFKIRSLVQPGSTRYRPGTTHQAIPFPPCLSLAGGCSTTARRSPSAVSTTASPDPRVVRRGHSSFPPARGLQYCIRGRHRPRARSLCARSACGPENRGRLGRGAERGST